MIDSTLSPDSTTTPKVDPCYLSPETSAALIAESQRRIAARRAEKAANQAIAVRLSAATHTMERRLATADRRHNERDRRFAAQPAQHSAFLLPFGL